MERTWLGLVDGLLWEGGDRMQLLMVGCFVAAVLLFAALARLASKMRCLGWVIGLACLIGFLYVVGRLR